jgi:hypothetical protein
MVDDDVHCIVQLVTVRLGWRVWLRTLLTRRLRVALHEHVSAGHYRVIDARINAPRDQLCQTLTLH